MLIEIRDLKTYFYTTDGVLPAVDGISLHIEKGESLGVVGESGCGKSVTALSIMGLVTCPPGRYVGGQVLFEGADLLRKTEAEMRSIRGRDIAMVFQEPMTSLNPVYTIGDQICEVVRLHQRAGPKEARQRAIEMLELVGVPDPQSRLNDYPHQFSGGMRQRVMIAMALSCNPKLLIADEPTTALDVTIQAQILELMRKLKRELGMAIMLITHDLGVIAEMAERVVVMYAGRVVEEASVRDLFRLPLHPYTEGLFVCIPRIDRPRGRLEVIDGVVPNPLVFPEGCRFNPRCRFAQEVCRHEEPVLKQVGPRRYACHFQPGERRVPEEVA